MNPSAREGAVEAIVEIPRGSRNKCEMNHETGEIRLDRALFSSVHYPSDYGFIPGTMGSDGDPLDVLIVVEEPTFPGCHVFVRLIGVLVMEDEKGLDEKLLAVPVADPRFNGIRDIKDLQPHGSWKLRTLSLSTRTWRAAKKQGSKVGRAQVKPGLW